MPLVRQRLIRRADLRANRHALYVFGDNLAGTGLGGQAAEMRFEPNAVGIPTKLRPSRSPGAYLTDRHLTTIEHRCTPLFARLRAQLAAGGIVVWPADGIGTGLARIEEKAPAVKRWLDHQLAALEALAPPVARLALVGELDRPADALDREILLAALRRYRVDEIVHREGSHPELVRAAAAAGAACRAFPHPSAAGPADDGDRHPAERMLEQAPADILLVLAEAVPDTVTRLALAGGVTVPLAAVRRRLLDIRGCTTDQAARPLSRAPLYNLWKN
jgi:hypothetical protein